MGHTEPPQPLDIDELTGRVMGCGTEARRIAKRAGFDLSWSMGFSVLQQL